MAARGIDPVRRSGRASRAKPGASDPELQQAEAAPPASGFVALTGLAVAPPITASPDRLRTGLQTLGARPKLLVGRSDDPAEAEADAMAEAVLHRLRRSPADRADESEPVTGSLRRAAASGPAPTARQGPGIGAAGGEVDSQTEQALRAAGATGTPLAPAIRREYEQAFGADLGGVRVHSGPASARLNSALGAQAFTLGSDIYFGDRVPSTAATADRHLMAHELAHTLQDGSGARRAMVRRLAVQITPAWDAAEAEDVIDEVMLPGADEHPHLEATHSHTEEHPHLEATHPHTEEHSHTEALSGEHPGSSDEAMMVEPTVTGEQPAEEWELIVQSVAIVGRPTTLFSGSMGDHMTAFVISRKGVENAVFGQRFPVAVRELDKLVADLEKLPGWDLVDSLAPAEDGEMLETVTEPATTELGATGLATTGLVTMQDTTMEGAIVVSEAVGSASPSSVPILTEVPVLDEEGAEVVTGPYRRASHHARFREAERDLAHRRQLLDEAGADDLKVLRLQDYIAAYLELRELVPLSASNWLGANRGKGGKGDGESGLEGFLAKPGTQRPGNLRRDFLSTIATYRMAQAAIEPNKDALAILMPGLDHALSADERTELMARQHVQSVLSNFPKNFAGLADDILWAEGGEPVGKGSGAASAERDTDADFAIILNHLTRIVRLRYSEAAEQEHAHQLTTASLARRDGSLEEVRTAEADAAALAMYLKVSPPSRLKTSALTKEEKDSGRVPKRERDGGPESVEDEEDDLYQGLSRAKAKRVYTGLDVFKKLKTDPPGPLPKSDLAVQLQLDDTGAILRPVVGRQGKYTKGAHTIPWVQWVLWLSADIIGKQPAAALAAFTTTTIPAIRAKLRGDDLAVTTPMPMPTLVTEPMPTLTTEPVPTLTTEPMPTAALELAVEEPTEVEPGSMPLIELQVAIADLLDEITDAADSSVLDATDTGGKGESHHRVELRAYENGERDFTPEELVAHLLALCDVGEAESELAQRTVKMALKGAQTDYPKAYAASLISEYELEDLVDRASIGKTGVYEYSSDADSESESESEETPRAKKRKKKAHKGK